MTGKPIRGTSILVLLACATAVLIGKYVGMGNDALAKLSGAGVLITIACMSVVHVVRWRWVMRQQLNEKIIRDAERFEAIRDEVYQVSV